MIGGVGSVGAVHPWRMVLLYTPNLHSCVDVHLGGNDLDWDALYGLLHAFSPCQESSAGPAVATAEQQTRLSAQCWATLMAGPFWGRDDCSQSCVSSGNWPCGQIGTPSQSRGRLHAVLQPPLFSQQGNKASTPTHRH